MSSTAESSAERAGAAGPSTPLMVAVSFGLNVLLLAGIFGVWLASRSQLLLAQGADSLHDLVAGSVLLWSARVARLPRDENHPFGHQRAEPIGALVIAVLTGVLSFEVLRTAVEALRAGVHAELGGAVAGALAAKLLVKLGLVAWLVHSKRARRSAAVRATLVDASNDVASSASSLVGWGLVRAGFGWADALLAVPVALYVAWNGISLARSSVGHLMGEAPPEDVLVALRAEALAVPGVLALGRLRAQQQGHDLLVQVEILIEEASSAARGHDIALEVQDALEAHPLVGEAFVHVDTRSGRDHG